MQVTLLLGGADKEPPGLCMFTPEAWLLQMSLEKKNNNSEASLCACTGTGTPSSKDTV